MVGALSGTGLMSAHASGEPVAKHVMGAAARLRALVSPLALRRSRVPRAGGPVGAARRPAVKPALAVGASCAIAIAACVHLEAGSLSQARQPVEWSAYGHDAAGTKYSPAAQISRANVRNLVPVWTYRTGDFALGNAMARDETTPLFVDNVLYASTPFGGVRALDGDTGAELWSFDSELDLSGDYGDFTNRGVSTWVDRSRPSDAVCHRRIFVAPVDGRLIALDARTGVPCPDFGTRGQIDLTRGVVNAPSYKGEYAVMPLPRW